MCTEIKKKKKNEEQQNKLLKNLNHYKGRPKNKAPVPHDEKIKLSKINIKFDKEKLINLLTAQRKPKIRRYYGVYSDDGVKTGEEFGQNNSKSSYEEIVRKKKKTQTKKRTVAKTTVTPDAKKEEEKTTKRNYRLYKQLIVIK